MTDKSCHKRGEKPITIIPTWMETLNPVNDKYTMMIEKKFLLGDLKELLIIEGV